MLPEKKKPTLNIKTHGATGWLSRLSVQVMISSGHDLTVCELKPHMGLRADGSEPAWDSLSPSLSVPPPAPLALSLKINK